MGQIREISLKGRKIGGGEVYPFYSFDGRLSFEPLFALEVWDMVPVGWVDCCLEAWGDVVADPIKWAERAQSFGADGVCMYLLSTDPAVKNTPPEVAAQLVKTLAAQLSTNLIIWGSGNVHKDSQVLKAVAQECADYQLLLGPVKEENYATIAAAAMAYSHIIVANTAIDVNLCKQLNILLMNLGVASESLVIDPTTGGLGYGLEYSYSVIERIRQAALNQDDSYLQMPIICHIGREVWRAREHRQPALGDMKEFGITWEATTAVALALAGADILVLRHPEALRRTKSLIQKLYYG